MHAAISDLSGNVLNRLRKACAAAAASGGANPLFRVRICLIWRWRVKFPFICSWQTFHVWCQAELSYLWFLVCIALSLLLYVVGHSFVQESTDAAFPDMDNFYGAESGPTIRSLMEVIIYTHLLVWLYFDNIYCVCCVNGCLMSLFVW